MPESSELSETGFAEFVSQLIADTFAAVVESQLQQEQQIAELLEAADRDPVEFARQFIDDEAVSERLTELFPSKDPRRPHAIFVNAPYVSPNPGPESPAIGRLLGVELERSDIVISRDGTQSMKRQAVVKVTEAARQQLAESQLLVLQLVATRGIPRVAVDSGHVKAKITFQLEQETEERTSAAGQSRFQTFPSRQRLLPGRILVRQADERAPQTIDLSIDVFGEVEVTFKTIT